jgi:hypothetical protein
VTEEVEVEGETAMDLYMTLGPWPARLGSVEAAMANRQPRFPEAGLPSDKLPFYTKATPTVALLR